MCRRMFRDPRELLATRLDNHRLDLRQVLRKCLVIQQQAAECDASQNSAFQSRQDIVDGLPVYYCSSEYLLDMETAMPI